MTEDGHGAPARRQIDSRAKNRLIMFGVLVVAIFGLVVPVVILVHNGNDKASEVAGGITLTADQTKGRELFTRACTACHTLSAVKSVGRVGPNLDVLIGHEISGYESRRELVLHTIMEGKAEGKGQMPALLYEGKEAKEVAEFVATVAGH